MCSFREKEIFKTFITNNLPLIKRGFAVSLPLVWKNGTLIPLVWKVEYDLERTTRCHDTFWEPIS